MHTHMRILITIGTLVIGAFSCTYATFFDNRFFVPYLTYKPPVHLNINHSRLSVQPFLLSADEAFSPTGCDTRLFEFNQCYDQHELDQAIQLADKSDTSFFRSDIQSRLQKSPWCMPGRLEAQGIAFHYDQYVSDWFGVGLIWPFLQINSHVAFSRKTNNFSPVVLGPGDEQELLLTKEQMHKAIRIKPGLYDEMEPGDLDFYGRIFVEREYPFRFQYLLASIFVGGLAPVSSQRDIHNPVSIPAGGNGHWGFYVQGEVDAILKDDLRAGINVRVQKRLSEVAIRRMPILDEAIRYGTLVGPARVHPGVTGGFAPYISLEGLREGFGLQVSYQLVGHSCDRWEDINHLGADIQALQHSSRWLLEHVTVSALYDATYASGLHNLQPIISLSVDVPVEWIASERAFKTYGVSLIVECSF